MVCVCVVSVFFRGGKGRGEEGRLRCRRRALPRQASGPSSNTQRARTRGAPHLCEAGLLVREAPLLAEPRDAPRHHPHALRALQQAGRAGGRAGGLLDTLAAVNADLSRRPGTSAHTVATKRPTAPPAAPTAAHLDVAQHARQALLDELERRQRSAKLLALSDVPGVRGRSGRGVKGAGLGCVG